VNFHENITDSGSKPRCGDLKLSDLRVRHVEGHAEPTFTKLVALFKIPSTVSDAWISAMPFFSPVTRPAGETDAIGDPIQAADDVKSFMVPSEKVPVAVSCTVAPIATQGLTGVIVSEARVAGVTVTVVEPEIPSWVAVMVALPTAVPVTRPLGSTVASDGAGGEVQLTECVRSCVLPSEKFPVAVNGRLSPLAIEGFIGVIVIVVRTAGVTVTTLVAILRIPSTVTVAWMSPCPAIIPVTRPAGETDALGAPIQSADDLKSCVVPSEKVPVAVS